MGKIILIKYSTKLPIFQGFRVIISLPELYFFANIRFKSHTLNTFSSCLQSKEILFVQQRFRYSFAAERKKPGFGVANRPLRSPDFYYSPCILPRKQEKNLSCLGRQKRFLLWRSGWDSNPRNLAVQLISSQSRYDHFDTAPYLSQHQHLRKRGELMGRTSKNIKLRIPEKPRKIKGFRTGSYRVATTISSQSRYDHFDTSPYLGESFRITVLL